MAERAKENKKIYIKSKTRDRVCNLHINPAGTKPQKADNDNEKADILSTILTVFSQQN